MSCSHHAFARDGINLPHKSQCDFLSFLLMSCSHHAFARDVNVRPNPRTRHEPNTDFCGLGLGRLGLGLNRFGS